MSPSGDVSIRCVKPVPGPLVRPVTVFAPKMRSVGFVVVADPLLVVPPFPVAADVTSTGLAKSAPLYSRIRMSGNAAPVENCTVTVFAPVAAARIFRA